MHDDVNVNLDEYKPLTEKPQPNRLISLDVFKGLIMIFMALDHCKHKFATLPTLKTIRNTTSTMDPIIEELDYVPADYDGDFWWWFTRHVTHTVLVGFVFAMGMGFYFLFKSRIRLNWSWIRVFRFYVIRAVVLILYEQVLDWISDLYRFLLKGQYAPHITFSTLWLLSWNMIMGCLILFAQKALHNRYPNRTFIGDGFVMLLGLSLLFGFYYAVPKYPAQPSIFAMIFAFPFEIHWENFSLAFLDSIGSWTPVVCFGILAGKVCCEKPTQGFKLIGVSGFICWIAFLFMRLPYVFHAWNFGNFRPIEKPLTYYSFFEMAKYPPSPAFISWWLGLDLFILWTINFLIEKIGDRKLFIITNSLEILKLFGSVPLFFWGIHLLVYMVIASPFPRDQTSLGGIYLECAIGLIICYLPTKAFAKFKETKEKDSLWRLF